MTAKEIREIRKKSGLSMEGFAHEIGVSVHTVWRWENNRGRPMPLGVRSLMAFNARRELMESELGDVLAAKE